MVIYVECASFVFSFCYMQVITDPVMLNIPGITVHIKYGIQYWPQSIRQLEQYFYIIYN